MKKVCSRCLKNHIQLDFKQHGIISSRTSTSLLQILEQFKFLAYAFNFRYMFIATPTPFYCKKKCSIDNSIRRLLFLKIVLHSLFADAVYGFRHNSAYADPFWLICGGSICIKKTFFHSGRDNFKSEVNTWAWIGPAHPGFSVATWKFYKIEESFSIRMLFPKISA